MNPMTRIRPVQRWTWLGFALVTSFLMSTTASSQPQSDSTRPPAALSVADAELEISIASRDRLRGVIKRGGIGLIFDSRKRGDSVFLNVQSLDGRQLLFLDGEGETVTATLGERGLTATAKKTDILAMRQRPKLPSAATAGEAKAAAARINDDLRALSQTRGDVAAFQRLKRSPEYGLLATLSFELRKVGMAGNTYPPSLALHAVGMAAAEVLGTRQTTSGIVYRQKLPPQLRRHGSIHDLFAPGESAGCWSGLEEGPNLEHLPPCPKQCTAYPNREEDCLGMCGDGCSCWSWVCGDCCHHHICLVHDASLRFCSDQLEKYSCIVATFPWYYLILGC